MRYRRALLLKQGEIFLKGQNRSKFQKKLRANIERAFPANAQVRVQPRGGMIVLYPESDSEALAQRMTQVPGVNLVDVALDVEKDPDLIAQAALDELQRLFGPDLGAAPRSFGVVAQRRDKEFYLTSEQLNRQIGALVQEATRWPVNLKRPDVSIRVDINFGDAFVSVQRLRGAGGLPVGSSGRAMALLSGGFDSPVAAYRMMKRGLSCDFIHFSGAPYTDPSSTYKAYALVKTLSQFQPEARLWVAQLGDAQKTLASSSDPALRTVAQRRLMFRIAEQLAGEQRAEALVTGDSLGQVASQTLSNIATVDEAVIMPVLRPLVGWDKDEIISEARLIGTEEISVLPDQDCCTLLAPPRPATHSDAQTLLKVERRAGVEDLMAETMAHLQEFRFSAGA